MGFVRIPADALPGLDRAMVGALPADEAWYDTALAPGVAVVH